MLYAARRTRIVIVKTDMSFDTTLVDVSAARGRQKKLPAFGTRSDLHCRNVLTSTGSRFSLSSALTFSSQNLSLPPVGVCLLWSNLSQGYVSLDSALAQICVHCPTSFVRVSVVARPPGMFN